MLMVLTLLRQKGSILCKISHDSSSLLKRALPSKCNNTSLFNLRDLDIKVSNNTCDDGKSVRFDSKLYNLCVDLRVTNSLTRFIEDFIEGTCVEIKERVSDVTTGKILTTREEIAACTLKDDNRDSCVSYTKIPYTLSCKHGLIGPEWLCM